MIEVRKRVPPGLPEHLPDGEVILWQGQPDWLSLARRAFHMYKVAAYFVVIVAGRMAYDFQQGRTAVDMMTNVAWTVLIAAIAIGLVAFLGKIYARTTIYTITNRRVVLKYGVALTMHLNLPFKAIEAASMKAYRDGTVDIPLALNVMGHVAYPSLWPFARPWRITRAEPMLRSIADGAKVAEILGEALKAYKPATPVETKPSDDKPSTLAPEPA